MSAREQRRLAAIVAADAVGYSRLMGRDESGTVARLRRVRTERLAPVLARRGGRLVKLTGDGALIEFASAVEALSAAIEFQQAMAEGEADRPEAERLVFRVGVHLGDVIVDSDDLYGDGVNVAARLEAEAPAGGIVISGDMHNFAAGRVAATFEDLGRLALKNIERPVQAYAVRWQANDWPPASPVASPPATAAPAPPDTPLSLPDKPSIAVLPFQNMSGDPEQEYFADGMVEDIITELTRFRSLFVISRNSSFSYKGKSPDMRDVGRQLGVRYVLEGSVRKADNRIRLTGQLIDTQTGSHIWAERYDRQLDDVFVVQEELTRSIVRAIAPQISESELARARRRHPENLTAYEIAVRASATAWDAYARSDRVLCDQAIRHSKSALAIDPDSTIALAAQTLAQTLHLSRATTADRAATWQDAVAAIERWLELEPSSSTAHARKGHLLLHDPNGPRFDDALAEARQGHDLNPHDMATLISVTHVEIVAGDLERAIEIGLEALRTSPRDPLRPHMRHQLAMASNATGRYAEAIEHARRGIAEAPALAPLHIYRAVGHVALGQYDQAKSAYADAIRIAPEYVDRILSGKFLGYSRDPQLARRTTTFVRIAAGLEDRGAVESLR